MKIGLVGGSNQQRSLPLDAQRTVNFYPVVDQQGKEPSALWGTPGLALFATAGSGPIRGCFYTHDGRFFVVSGATFYEITASATVTSRGTLLTSGGVVSIDENAVQVGICDGVNVYMFTLATNTFALVTDVNLPPAGTITFIDQYFVINKNDSGQFNISAVNDGTTWGALDFGTAESSPDDLLRVLNAVGQLWLFGRDTTEIWNNTGALSFPFKVIAGAKMQVGILSPQTALAIDNTVFWVGRDKLGQGIVYRADGFSPQRISTNAMELLIQAASSSDQIKAYSYQQEGHVFYVLSGGGLGTTLVYDIATQEWHERAYLNSTGDFEQHLGICGAFAFNKQMVGSRLDGKIYEMSQDIYDDDGNPLVAERIYTHLSNEEQRVIFRQLVIAMETGVGNSEFTIPLITLWISRDGGKTWSDGYSASIGEVGKYLTRVVFRRLGQAFVSITFKIRIANPVKRALIGSYLT